MSKWYEDARFQRHVLRECVSRRKGLLMHNKVCSIYDDDVLGMFYSRLALDAIYPTTKAHSTP